MKYSPHWAAHVVGEYAVPFSEEIQPGDDLVEQATVIKILLSCSKCGDKSETRCTMGQPRTQIARYALGHKHEP